MPPQTLSLRTANWPQLTVAIMKTKFAQQHQHVLQANDGDDEDDDLCVDSDSVVVVTKQRKTTILTLNTVCERVP